MAQQIEPIEISGKENKGEYLRVFAFPLVEDGKLQAVIYDKDDNVLFATMLIAETLEEVAEKLNLKLKTDSTKELLTEIMEADAKNGLYQTTYEKLDQLLVLCNEIREEILARRVIPVDDLEKYENHFIECLSTHILDEDRINNIKRDLKRLDDTINNKL
jgi:hypothetical protein